MPAEHADDCLMSADIVQKVVPEGSIPVGVFVLVQYVDDAGKSHHRWQTDSGALNSTLIGDIMRAVHVLCERANEDEGES